MIFFLQNLVRLQYNKKGHILSHFDINAINIHRKLHISLTSIPPIKSPHANSNFAIYLITKSITLIFGGFKIRTLTESLLKARLCL